MAIFTGSISTLISTLPPFLLFLLTPLALTVLVLVFTRVYTTLRYRISVAQQQSPTTSLKPLPPPTIPYTIPFLGSALSFLAPRPGAFWTKLFLSHPRATGACTLLLGGRSTHVLFSPSAVQTLFKTRGPSRHSFNLDVVVKGLGVDHTEALQFYGDIKGAPLPSGLTPLQEIERLNHDYLLKTDRVNEMTVGFTKRLHTDLKAERFIGGAYEGGLYTWLKPKIFKASTTAIMGSTILEMCPNLPGDFFDFDLAFLSLFFGIPKWFVPEAWKSRENCLTALERWQKAMFEQTKGQPADPDKGVIWEPKYGGRANRARQIYYTSRDLSMRARAGFDLGFLFGTNSNAIPATGWMLVHILNPKEDKTLLPRVMEEVEKAKREDGTVDITILIASPLLQSILHEILRLYVDVLVSRELKEDLVLPLDDEGKRQVLLSKSGIVMAPSWLGHRDAALWTDPPMDVFYAERFLKDDPETGKEVFSTVGTGGKLFPWGGGKSICPGRVFAKQEVLGSVAMVLLSFDLEVLGFIDEKEQETKNFPGLKQTYTGTGVNVMAGDLKVRVTRRKT